MTNESDGCIGNIDHFEDLTWLFTCDSRNRGIIRQGFDEASLLWKAVKATAGTILEIGRNRAGSTVLIAAASQGREFYSIDLKSNFNPTCGEYLTNSENKGRVHLLVADSRKALADKRYGFLFIDGDHSFEGVLADVVAHWNALNDVDGKAGLAAFHDALPNKNFEWRDAKRTANRFWIRLKNKFRKRQKPEIAPDYEIGVFRVCEELIRLRFAQRWGAAGSMLVVRKLADLPTNFAEVVRERERP